MKVNTKPLTGMMELLPEEQLEFERIKNIIIRNYEKFGFSPIDTPIIERTETLLAKAGGETEKQIYRFKKGDNDLSLRFDLTVPTARFVAENFGQLTFPLKRSQIGKVYRGERAQRGRFREFYQCDIDVIGRDKLSVNYDAEIISVIYSIFKELDFGKFTLRISNRNLATGLIEGLGLTEKSAEILALIDRAEKISEDEFNEQLSRLNLEKNETTVKDFIKISGDSDVVLRKLEEISLKLKNNSQFLLGISELQAVRDMLIRMGVDEDFFKLDMLIVRGLDYYTGTVFETNLDDFKQIGSVSSGGRYDNLTGYYSKEKLPGVGASIGLTRLFWVLRDLGLLNISKKTTADFLVIPFGAEQLEKSFEIANLLRNSGENVEVLLEEMNIKKAFKFADRRKIRFVLLVGEDEIAKNEYIFKDMFSGDKVNLNNFLKK